MYSPGPFLPWGPHAQLQSFPFEKVNRYFHKLYKLREDKKDKKNEFVKVKLSLVILSIRGAPMRTNQCPSPGNFDDYIATHCGNDKLC